MNGRYCWECYEILHPRVNHSKKEIENDQEMKIDYYLTPEIPSTKNFLHGHPPAASGAATKKSSDHGYVSSSAVERRQSTLSLIILHALAMLAIVLAMVPMGANAGAMPP